MRARLREIDVATAFAEQQAGAVLIDVREPDEVAAGSPAAALCLVRSFLELRIEDLVPDFEQPLLLMCAGGSRSLLAARDLQDLGYARVSSVAGGFTAWKAAGLPVERARGLKASERERYSRHLVIPEVGEAGQLRLLESSVLLIGAGGLGSPAAFYLAAAGVGRIGIVDDDVVERSNLQRQILHTDARVGQPKTSSARQTLQALNPEIRVDVYSERLAAANVERIFADYDVIVDGADNFPTRYLINDACVKLGKPNVHGSIFRFEGQVSVFWVGHPGKKSPCYRCLFPAPPPPELAPSCAEAGVLGVLPGVIGSLEAVEAIKLLLGIGEPLIGRLLVYDALDQRFCELKINRRPECRVCGDQASPIEYADDEWICSSL